MRNRRVRAYRSGLFAESLVALLLRLKGNRILARRYKTPVGELDLVALKGISRRQVALASEAKEWSLRPDSA